MTADSSHPRFCGTSVSGMATEAAAAAAAAAQVLSY